MSAPAVAATPVKKVARKPKDGAKKAKAPTHPPTMQMVVKAMMSEKTPKGVSVKAISKYIMEHHKIPASRLRGMLRRTLAAGLKEGKLTRPHGQATTAVLSGRYRLPAKGAAKAAADPAKKAPAKKLTAAKKTGAAKKKPASATKKAPAKKANTPKKAAAKPKAKSASKVKKTPKKPVAKKPVKSKTPKKAAKPAKKA